MDNVVGIPVGACLVFLMDDDRICQHVKKDGSFEPYTLEAWASVVGPGKVALDIGGYSGLFAIGAALLGATAIVIEPLPVMCERIKANAEINKAELVVMQLAASDVTGYARLGVNERVHLTAGASLLRKSGPGIEVKTSRVDDLNIGRVDALKIDVERAEMQVLEGARGMIEKYHPALIIETLDGMASRNVWKFLAPFGYEQAGFLDNRNMFLKRKP